MSILMLIGLVGHNGSEVVAQLCSKLTLMGQLLRASKEVLDERLMPV